MPQNFRFIHAADLHLDSPLVGLEVYADAPVEEIREATRKALKNLVKLCVDERVDFLLIAGDIYDGDWKSMATGRFFADQISVLGREGIPVFLIKGNHDAQSQISREMVLPGVRTFEHRHAETKTLEDIKVAIHGQSYSKRDVTEDLSAGYPPPVPGYFNIGMLHTCATGSAVHAAYAPCNIDDLIRKGYDYWALGHVHQRLMLNEDPPILFPGNLQGRHVREPADEGKGATLVDVANGVVVSMEHRPLDTVRWKQISVDASMAKTPEDVILMVETRVRAAESTCDGRLLATRLTISGTCEASHAIHKDLKSFDESLRSHIQGSIRDVWVEDVIVRTKSPNASESESDGGSLADLLQFVRTKSSDSWPAEAMRRFESVRDRVRSSSGELATDLGLDDPAFLTTLLPDVEEVIRALADGASK